MFVPASTIKVLAAQAAMATLGTRYKFTTNIWRGTDNQLVVEGRGDPMLVSEEIARMAQQLYAQKHRRFASLAIADNTIAWQLPPGSKNSTNPYDAPNGALILNFNTLNLRLEHGQAVSAEPQTPTIALAQRFVNRLDNNPQRFNLGLDKKLATTHAHQLIHTIFAHNGVLIDSDREHSTVLDTTNSKLLLSYANSLPLQEQIRSMLMFSNNYMANQLGLVMALESSRYSSAVTLRQGASLVEEYARNQLGMTHKTLQLEELSGLSRNNRISLAAMQSLLAAFHPHARLMRSYNEAASIPATAGVDIRGKSGTLKGIANLVGYIFHSKGAYSFIIHTSSNKNRDAILALLTSLSLR